MNIKIDDWSVNVDSDPYRAPELMERIVTGTVVETDSERLNVGKCIDIRTSRLIEISGKTLKSRGSTFILGNIDPNYEKYMKDNNIAFDPENPIRFKK